MKLDDVTRAMRVCATYVMSSKQSEYIKTVSYVKTYSFISDNIACASYQPGPSVRVRIHRQKEATNIGHYILSHYIATSWKRSIPYYSITQ